MLMRPLMTLRSIKNHMQPTSFHKTAGLRLNPTPDAILKQFQAHLAEIGEID